MHDLETMLADPHLTATDYFPVVEHPSEGPIRSMKVSVRGRRHRPKRHGSRRGSTSMARKFFTRQGSARTRSPSMVRDGVTKAGQD